MPAISLAQLRPRFCKAWPAAAAGVLALAAAAAQADVALRSAPLSPGESIRLDGRLDEPIWRRAPVHSQFHEIDPVRGRTPEKPTLVQMAWDERALYVAVQALDPRPDAVRRPLVRHDQVNRTQDFVVVYIDPVGQRKAAQFFRVNAAGSTADGLHTAEDDLESFAPDFDFDAATAALPGEAGGPSGWVAEFRIPYSSLRFDANSALPWRVMVGRRIPREQFTLLLSVPLAREALSFIDAMQPLADFQPPRDSRLLQWRPTLTARRTHRNEGQGQPPPAAATNAQSLEASLDVKWRPRPELVADLTLNPDFSQVELDVPQLAGNERFALFLSEKRPFFLESSDLFTSPSDALYTRSVSNPRWGVRSSWRDERHAATALLVADRGGGLTLLPGPYGTSAAPQPANDTLMARWRSSQGALGLGALATHRRYALGGGDNSVAGVDTAWRISPQWQWKLQALGSRTTAWPTEDDTEALPEGSLRAGPARSGHYLTSQVNGRVGAADSSIKLTRISPGFRNDAGFVAQAGVQDMQANQQYTWQAVGPLNQLTLLLNLRRTEAWGSGERVSQSLRPGVYATAARNTEFTIELEPASRLRGQAGAPEIKERYVHVWGQTSPATWLPLVEASLDVGQLADVAAARPRDGERSYFFARLRPLARLELEPSVDHLVLRSEGRRQLRETAVQLLAIAHLGPRQTLRLISQHSRFDRRADAASGLAAEAASRQTTSITYTWRQSAGTVLYVGAARSSSSAEGAAPTRNSEAFVKLQFDVAELRSAWPG